MAPIPINRDMGNDKKGGGWRSLSELENILLIAILALLITLFVYLPEKVSLNGLTMPIKIVILLLIALHILSRFIVKFDEYERGVIFRFGKFEGVTGPGLKIILPMVERCVRVDTRLNVYTTEPHEVVTKDRIRFMIGAAVFMYVSNPRDAVINMGDYKSALIHYVDGSLRSICGSSTSDYIVSHMDEISKTIKDNLNKLAGGMKGWGIIVERIEIKYIQFPVEVQEAMHKKAIKDIESKLAVVDPVLPPAETKEQDVAVVDKKPEGGDTDAEVGDYEKRIKEIKKRIGVDEFW